MEYTLRSKNKGKRWGIWNKRKKKWHHKPRFVKVEKELRPLDISASEVSRLLPQLQPQQSNDGKKQSNGKKQRKPKENQETPTTGHQ